MRIGGWRNCPCCDESLSPATLRAHLRECAWITSLPGALRSQAALAVHLKALEVWFVRRQLIRAVNASKTFSSDMGFNGKHAYARDHDERIWDRSRWWVRHRLGYAGRRREQPQLETSLAGLVTRVADPSHGDEAQRAADLETLARIAEDLRGWRHQYGLCVACPCCERPGLHPTELADHLVRCFAHPANARARERESELGLSRNVVVARPRTPARQIEPLIPGEYVSNERYGPDGELLFDRFEDRWFADFNRSLPDRKDALRDYDRDRLTAWLLEWAKFKASIEAPCPCCGEPTALANIAEHMIECSAHPARLRTSALERTLPEGVDTTPLRTLQALLDDDLLQLTRLLDAAAVFSARMGTDDRFRSLADNVEDLAWWEVVTKEADAHVSNKLGSRTLATWSEFLDGRRRHKADERAAAAVNGHIGFVPELELTPDKARTFFKALRERRDDLDSELEAETNGCVRDLGRIRRLGWSRDAWARVLLAFDRSLFDRSSYQEAYVEPMSSRLARGLDARGTVMLSRYFVDHQLWLEEQLASRQCSEDEIESRMRPLAEASALFHALLGSSAAQVAALQHRVPKAQTPRSMVQAYRIGRQVIEDVREGPITREERSARIRAAQRSQGQRGTSHGR